MARQYCPPNPAVACVLAAADGTVLGAGHTQATGQAHAEVMALRDAAARGHDVRGATAHVTLEPCSHYGRTPPCCDALVAAGIKRVVVTILDPNPLVAGQGVARLRAAGIEVDVLPPGSAAAQAARELNLGFFSRMLRRTPWVRLKAAASLDGITALDNGASQWITAAPARADGHAWRARACAILTGVGTILADDPALDARLAGTPRAPRLVIVDSELRTPPHAAALVVAPGRPVLVVAARAEPARRRALEDRGVTVIELPGDDGRVDLAALLRELAAREINEVHVEAGATLNGALLRAALVDELLLYTAPKLLGDGAGIACGIFAAGPLRDVAAALPLQFNSATLVGNDLRVLARVAGRDRF
ncbi:bifunctional diaminohydroxyphosphoribosylaminopyrimidine deaminase/5-amino-6-(5-phosphoribosylamino)uracil reductase RibD [Pseudoduganella armeniaca]|uniref:Riboflavin biosynthesis protein RibD n=1 Tax=Pseudoduganella armeniaca TaxID=2072590 RepID=A0A2R4CI21_9BURK|nr:bifunctional diaminohydroxyphosphoribosylaminopyrimidine deaminase/5-amino-6-(5-phosphoribosylamino)uracil reductase RibD [Pseudoduganella armeniaca]AVR99299.1 bifunctional diaminohydroxyphosphoribosylaminopyrimidine deaminase/5-amino-6-(5-phosphoribosylamino)uracil reductase RibD [Pseudoduganella armeniaca]